MYKIPVEIKLSELVNELINQISFGYNYVILSFEKGSVQFSGPFSIEYNGLTTEYGEVYPLKGDFGLLQFIENRITHIDTNEERNCLIIEFENKGKLCLKSNEMYESFEININGERIII